MFPNCKIFTRIAKSFTTSKREGSSITCFLTPKRSLNKKIFGLNDLNAQISTSSSMIPAIFSYS